MLSDARVLELLEPYEISLSRCQVETLLQYMELLLRWNRKINLTSIKNPEECVTRHFGESLLLGRYEAWDQSAQVLDVGSGAGFPGLALKLIFPGAQMTLLEPIAKKRAFLKEAVRTCGMSGVVVRPERLEGFMDRDAAFDAVTARAVGGLPDLVKTAAKLISERGRIHLWISERQEVELDETELKLVRRIQVPLSRDREIVTLERQT